MSLSLYHFNLQYNAGNLKSYHVLITKSFKPFLEFYMEYPQFKASCEIQGHAVAFMARFYPELLEKLVELVMDRKQIELVSVHYSDQVFLAYPKYDLQQSIRINDKTLARYGLKRGGTWFAQENFFGPGVIPIMKENGYRVALLNRHFLRHYQGEVQRVPYFERDGIYFLSGSGFSRGVGGAEVPASPDYGDALDLLFDYWGDGELAFTQGNNYFPFHGPSEKKRLKRLHLYTKRHKEGIETAFCTDYVDAMVGAGVPATPLPVVLDGSWNYPIYGGVYLWMGRYRLWWEKDGYVRSGTFKVRAIVLAAELLLAKVDSPPVKIRNELEMAWRHLLLAEVSDSTGQTPVMTEVKYSFSESALAQKYATGVISWVKDVLGFHSGARVLVDLRSGKIEELGKEGLGAFYSGLRGIPSNLVEMYDALGELGIQTWNMKKAKISVRKRPAPELEDGIEHEFYLNWDFKGRPTTIVSRVASFVRQNNNFKFHEKFDKFYSNYVGFTVPLKEEEIIFCPALMENDLWELPLSSFKIQETIGKTFLPLPNGLIGIGEGLYLIKHNLHGNTHIAATVDTKRKTVGFLQDCPPATLHSRWKFSLLKGERESAVKRANELNVMPQVLV
ncbi:MAG: hypothetical protein ACTSU9_14495 [Promethearchaeota archaeon]